MHTVCAEVNHRAGVQLYTLRALDESVPALITRVGEHGFDGVEFASRLPDASIDDVREALTRSDLAPIGIHVGLDELRTDRSRLVSMATAVGAPRLVVPHISIREFRTQRQIDELGAELADIAWALDEQALSLAIHTTREQLLPYVGLPGLTRLLSREGMPTGAYTHLAWAASRPVARTHASLRERTPLGQLSVRTSNAPVSFELDVKSAVSAGYDVGEVLDVLDGRVPLVHISDVVRSRVFPPDYAPVTPDTGMVDVEATLAAIEHSDVDWVVYEHDDPDDPVSVLHTLGELATRHRRADRGRPRARED